ncbi:MAG: signal peptidase I [Chryseolinea sp.]
MLKILKSRQPKRAPKSFVKEWFNSIVFAVIAATLIRWTTVEAFVVPTPSMENTIMVGDYLFVSKFHYGTRTTTTPLQIPLVHQKIPYTNIPSYLEWIELPSYRLPGISEVKQGDVVVFNVPPISLNNGEVHPVQMKTNYVKRCVALPGDELVIRDSEVIVNGRAMAHPANMKHSYIVVSDGEITTRSKKLIGVDPDDCFYLGYASRGNNIYRMHLTDVQFEAVRKAVYIKEVKKDCKGDFESDIFPSSIYSRWSGDNYGPLVMPKKGMTIIINDSTLAFYGETILLYDHAQNLSMNDHQLLDNGVPLKEYTFKQDYYFMMGDNRHNSLDSRYWGFVPEDHIVGKPIFIWLSMDSNADFIHKIRWSRMFTAID